MADVRELRQGRGTARVQDGAGAAAASSPRPGSTRPSTVRPSTTGSVGLLLAGRYRLDERRGRDGDSSVWDGRDQQLDRGVLVRVVSGEAVAPTLVAARAAALHLDPALARILDTGSARATDGTLLAWVVEERPAGERLGDLVRERALEPDDARAVLSGAAAALARAAAAGHHHRRLGPASLYVRGREVVVSGLLVAAAAAGVEDVDDHQAERDDAVGLVCLLYAALSGLWPYARAEALGAAPRARGGAVPLRDLAPSTPADLDALAAETLGPLREGPVSPAQVEERLVAHAPARREVSVCDGSPLELGWSATSSPHAANEPAPAALVAATCALPPATTGESPAPVAAREVPPSAAAQEVRAPAHQEAPGEQTAVLPAAPAAGAAGWSAARAARSPRRAARAARGRTGADPVPEARTSGVQQVPARVPEGPAHEGAAVGDDDGTRADQGTAPTPAVAPGATRGTGRSGGERTGGERTATATGTARAALGRAGARTRSAATAATSGRATTRSAEPARSTGSTSSTGEQEALRLVAARTAGRTRSPLSGVTAGVVAAVVVVLLVVAVAVAWRGLPDLGAFSLSGQDGASAPAQPAAPAAPVDPAAPAPPAQEPAPGPAPVVTGARALDPDGDGRENDDRLPALLDGDPGTSWTSETYASASFGNLKPGVGVVLDLAAPATVASVELDAAGTGGAVEVRTSPDGSFGGSTVVATADLGSDGAPATITLPAPVETAHVVLWVTRLPAAPDGFSADLSGVVLR